VSLRRRRFAAMVIDRSMRRHIEAAPGAVNVAVPDPRFVYRGYAYFLTDANAFFKL
jgi:uncharacterized membrane protein